MVNDGAGPETKNSSAPDSITEVNIYYLPIQIRYVFISDWMYLQRSMPEYAFV